MGSASDTSKSTARVSIPRGPVFISYRHSDGREIAVALAWALRAAGVPVWHDQTDLPPGDTERRLAEALSSGLSGAVLVVTREIEDSGANSRASSCLACLSSRSARSSPSRSVQPSKGSLGLDVLTTRLPTGSLA